MLLFFIIAPMNTLRIVQCDKSWKRLAFQQFQRGPAAGRDVGHAHRLSRNFSRRGTVASANNGNHLFVLCQIAQRGGNGERSGFIGFHFKHAHGSIPQCGAAILQFLLVEGDRLGANVQRHISLWNIHTVGHQRLVAFGEFGVAYVINGELHINALLLGLFEQFESQLQSLSFLGVGFSNFLALGLEEGVGHSATNQEFVNLLHQLFQEQNLVGNFGSTNNGDKRLRRFDQNLAKGFDFLLDEVSSRTLSQNFGDPSHTGGVAMSSSKGVRHIKIAIRSQSLGHDGAFFFLLGGFVLVETKILQDQCLAVDKGVNLGLRVQTILGEQNLLGGSVFLLQELLQASCDRLQASRVFGRIQGCSFVHDTLGASQMAHENGFSSLGENLLNRRQSCPDSQVVCDGAICDRNIEVNADQDFFARQITKVVDSFLQLGAHVDLLAVAVVVVAAAAVLCSCG
mmetsp:Transcript_10956/g.24463  ORF Transcript_10956/g.24463 Transcript_10956/m.24463 type:complete len:455 (+) Transcript_10956:955-2319(+)